MFYHTYTVYINSNNKFYKNLIDIGKINKAIFNSTLFFFRQNFFYYQKLIEQNVIKFNPMLNIKSKDLINFFSNSPQWTNKLQSIYNHPLNILPNKGLYSSQNTQVLQQTIISLYESIKSFIKLYKLFLNKKLKYRPNLPKYIKNDTYVSTFTNQLCNINYQDINNIYNIKNIKFIKGTKLIRYKKEKNILTYDQIKKANFNINNFIKVITFPKGSLQDLIININHIKDLYKFKELRIHFKHNIVIIDVVYEIQIQKKKKRYKYKRRYCGIDLGVNILAACSFSCNISNILFKGNEIKKINNKYNYLISKYMSLNQQNKKKQYIFKNQVDNYFKDNIDIIYDKRIQLDKYGNKYILKDNYTLTKKIHKLWIRRENKIKDIFHKVSRKIVDYCIKRHIDVIVIGRNKNWKQKKKMKNFVQIPFYKLVQMIIYKAKEKGIRVEEVNERYTSGCSCLDRELPIKEKYNKSRRLTRGLFRSNEGKSIHADINAAYNMIIKWKYNKLKQKQWKSFKTIRKSYTGMLLSNYKDIIVI